MIDALIQGKLYGQPQSRSDSKGKTYAIAKIRAAVNEGESVFISCIAFGEAAMALLAMDDGQPLAAVGTLSPKAYADKQTREPRPSLDMQVQQVLTLYHVRHKRQQVQGGQDGT